MVVRHRKPPVSQRQNEARNNSGFCVYWVLYFYYPSYKPPVRNDTTMTGILLCLMTYSATLPSSRFSRPVRP